MPESTPTERGRVRYACCEHCVGEGCPRIQGHAAACAVEDCTTASDISTIHPDPTYGEDPYHDGVLGDISHWREEERVAEMRERLIDEVAALVGHEPPGLRVLLRSLSHPSIAGQARAYFESMDIMSRCTKYEPPWNCAREAEAQYQNISYGWGGAAGGVGCDESWCENCRSKVLGDGLSNADNVALALSILRGEGDG